jgi:hypothetical protein
MIPSRVHPGRQPFLKYAGELQDSDVPWKVFTLFEIN